MNTFHSLRLLFVAVTLLLLNSGAQAQTTEENHRELITFNCSAGLIQLANTSFQECHEIHGKFNRTHLFTTESSVADSTTSTDHNDLEDEEDHEEDEIDDEVTTEAIETSSRVATRFNRRQRWRRIKKQRKMAIKKCVYEKIKEDNQVKEVFTQCQQRVVEHGNVENRPARDQICAVKTVLRNCLPKDKKPRNGRRGAGLRRFFRRQQQ